MPRDTLRPPGFATCGFVPDDGSSIAMATGGGHYRELSALRPVAGARRPSSIVLTRTPPLIQWWQDCVANAVADAYLYELIVAGIVPAPADLFTDSAHYADWLPSRRKLYWDARAIVGAERIDAGTQPGALVRAVRDFGLCAERWCPYDGAPEQNPLADHDEAGRMSMDQAGRIELFACLGFGDIIDALAMGHRVLFAGPVFESMAEVGPGQFYIPSGKRLGLHMWQLVGFEDDGAIVRMKNQWPGWGDDAQEAFASRATIEQAMMVAYAFSRVVSYSEVSR